MRQQPRVALLNCKLLWSCLALRLSFSRAVQLEDLKSAIKQDFWRPCVSSTNFQVHFVRNQEQGYYDPPNIPKSFGGCDTFFLVEKITILHR
jgi:hypothetical protein